MCLCVIVCVCVCVCMCIKDEHLKCFNIVTQNSDKSSLMDFGKLVILIYRMLDASKSSLSKGGIQRTPVSPGSGTLRTGSNLLTLPGECVEITIIVYGGS